jgi:DNA polymerase III subunit beta
METIALADNVVALRSTQSVAVVIAETSVPDGTPAHAGDGTYTADAEFIALDDEAEQPADVAVADVPEPVVPARLTVSRDAFATAVAAVVRAVERRNTIPVLANLLIAGNEHGMKITGTNLDIAIAADVCAHGDSHFAATVPAHMLADVLKKAKIAESIILSYDSDAKVTFKLGDHLSVDLHSLPTTDFPQWQAGDLSHAFTMETDALVRVFEKVQFAISTEETRYYLNGVYVHHVPANRVAAYNGDNGMLRFVAIDGHRMAVVELPAPRGSENMAGYIIQRDAVKQFLALAKAKGAPRTVTFNVHGPLVEKDDDGESRCVVGPRLSFTIGNVTLASKPIDGAFPDYARVVPTGNDHAMRVAVADIAAAIEQATCISSERGRAVRLSVTATRLCLSVTNPDAGAARSEIECDYTVPSDGAYPELDIGFNSRYLLDILGHVDQEVAVIKFADPCAPTLIQGEGAPDVTFVLMPMRV